MMFRTIVRITKIGYHRGRAHYAAEEINKILAEHADKKIMALLTAGRLKRLTDSANFHLDRAKQLDLRNESDS